MTNEEISEDSADLKFIVLLDQMGERYGVLPSKILNEASTIDLFVYDTAVSFRQMLERKANGEKPTMDNDVLLKKYKDYNASKSKGQK